MKDTDNANMKDFDKTGCKILPTPPRFIDNKTHTELLDESFKIYGHIWEELAKQ